MQNLPEKAIYGSHPSGFLLVNLGNSIVATGQFEIAAEVTLGKYGEIAELPRWAEISYAFAYVFAMFATSPAPSMESTRGAAEDHTTCGNRQEAASHCGCWGGGKHSKNISKCT